MNNNKQSSVEWLIEKLSNYDEEMLFLYQNEIEQAKAIHKEEIITAAANHCYPTYEIAKVDAEQYYNETFGGNQ